MIEVVKILLEKTYKILEILMIDLLSKWRLNKGFKRTYLPISTCSSKEAQIVAEISLFRFLSGWKGENEATNILIMPIISHILKLSEENYRKLIDAIFGHILKSRCKFSWLLSINRNFKLVCLDRNDK